MTKQKFKEIINYIDSLIHGTEFQENTFAVGGSVRDFIMGNDIKDIDIVVSLPDGGIKLAEFLHDKKVLTRPPVVYPTYGTAMFKFKRFNQDEIECVQTRGEQYHDKDSRNPETCFATIQEDCIRRDLTMNALYMNVTTGEILDLTGKGVEDINNHICRVTNEDPDVVFTDDPLRILRVMRFACRYNFDIEENTFESMKKNVDRLAIITQERITDEFNKMLMSPDPARALCLIGYTNAMKYVIPELIETYGMEQNAYHYGTVWNHTLGLMCHVSHYQPYLPTRLACVLHDIGKIKTKTVGEDGRIHFYDHETVGADMARDIMKRMRYSNDIIDEVCFYVKYHMVTKSWGDDLGHMKMKTLRKLMYKAKTEDRFNHLIEVIDCDNCSHKKEHCMWNQGENILKVAANEKRMFGYQLPINGNEVMEVLGIEPGPKVKKYLDHCMKLAFNNPEITKEACIKQIKSFKVE